MAQSRGKNPFLGGFLTGLAVGLALAVAVAYFVTRHNPFADRPAATGGAPAPAPSAPAEAPKYEFYQAEPQAAPAGAAPAAADTLYYLQAGAFAHDADAEAMKARLALLGFEAKIQPGQEGETRLYRLRIGPYRSLDELNRARARLTQEGVDTMLVKTDESQEEKR